jgi:hypothetical protein
MKHIIMALVLLTSTASAQVVSQNNLVQKDLGWYTAIQGNGNAAVTGAKPRYGFGDVGFGSLQLHTTGKMEDWVFAYRYAETNWGMLSQLSSLSFDWYRSSNPNWDADVTKDGIQLYDWKYKSPAFRVFLDDNTEIVWENYFNRPIDNDVSYVDTWQTSEMINGNFWYRNEAGYSLSNGPCLTSDMPVWGGGVQALTISEIVTCYGDKQIVGVGVGLGSQWPYAYKGFVDNVIVTSNGNQVLNTNFDHKSIPTTTVPEPSTYAMMLVGLVGIGMVTRRKRMS